MTRPTDGEITPDPDVAEDFADDVGVDPTQEEIDTYRRLEGEEAPDPPPASDGPVSGCRPAPPGRGLVTPSS